MSSYPTRDSLPSLPPIPSIPTCVSLESPIQTTFAGCFNIFQLIFYVFQGCGKPTKGKKPRAGLPNGQADAVAPRLPIPDPKDDPPHPFSPNPFISYTFRPLYHHGCSDGRDWAGWKTRILRNGFLTVHGHSSGQAPRLPIPILYRFGSWQIAGS